MEIGDWLASEDTNGIYRELRELGLESNVAELDAFGFTLIPNALSPDLTVALRDAVLRSAETKFGKKLDLENETDHHNIQLAPYLLFTDPVFEQAVLNPKPLALATYLVGQSCALSSVTSHVKGPGENELGLHSDTGNGVPAPLSPYSHVTNVNYALTDYTEEAGALAMVPGSHRFARHPLTDERWLTGNRRNPLAIPLEVPAGTAIIWHGNTWHGSFPRRIKGLRVNLAVYYVRQYMETQELYRDRVPPEFLARYGPETRMHTLMGLKKFNGWGAEGPKMEIARSMKAGRSWTA